MFALQVWPGKKQQRIHSDYKRIISNYIERMPWRRGHVNGGLPNSLTNPRSSIFEGWYTVHQHSTCQKMCRWLCCLQAKTFHDTGIRKLRKRCKIMLYWENITLMKHVLSFKKKYTIRLKNRRNFLLNLIEAY